MAPPSAALRARGLLLALFVCVPPGTATPHHVDSNSLVSFLEGLGPAADSPADDRCLLTAKSRDQILRQLMMDAPTRLGAAADIRPFDGEIASEPKSVGRNNEDGIKAMPPSGRNHLSDSAATAIADVPTVSRPPSVAPGGESSATTLERRLTANECIDTNDGATDGWNGCATYSTEWCGNYDDTDFSSEEMCCVCGGGMSPTPTPTQCIDTNDVYTNTNGDDCSIYSSGSSICFGSCTVCGDFDSALFSSDEMCCVCGGGMIPPRPTSMPTTSPTTMPTTSPAPTSCLAFVMEDSYGDGWQGAQYVIRDASTDLVMATGSLASGSRETDNVCLGDGCYSLGVTHDSFVSEVSWTFGTTMSGGSPYAFRFFTLAGSDVEGPFQSCPTPAPTTHSLQPTPVPTITPFPTTTPVPSNLPTPVPTSSPTSNCFEARTWDELNNALQTNGAKVNVTRDIVFTQPISLDGGQDVTVFCNATGEAAQGSVSYCATLDGGGETQLFEIAGVGSCLRLIRLKLTNGYHFQNGGAIIMGSNTEAHLTACMVCDNEAYWGGVFYMVYAHAVVLHVTSCVITNNEATRHGGVFYIHGSGASPAPVVYLSGCTVNNNHAVRSDQKICSTLGGIMVNSLPFGFAVGVGAHPSPDDANIL